MPHAGLVRVDADGAGPETAVIRPAPTTRKLVPGLYRVWVHNKSGRPGFDAPARLTVTQGNRQLGAYEASAARGNPSLGLWHVADVTVTANGQVRVRPVQRFARGGAATVPAASTP